MKRFKKFLTAAALCTVCLSVSTTASAEWRYGVRVGGAISTSRSSNLPDYDVKGVSGFSGGVTFEWQHPTMGWAADASLLYTHVGSKLQKGDFDNKTRTDFLHVPLNVKYKFHLKSTKNLLAPYVYTGPDVMLGVGKVPPMPADTHRLQPGWNVGIGFDIINILQIQAGYRFSLGNNAVHRDWFDVRDHKIFNDYVSISAAVLFDF